MFVKNYMLDILNRHMLAICKVLCQACDILGYKNKVNECKYNINYYGITMKVNIQYLLLFCILLEKEKKWNYDHKILCYL